MVKLDETKEQRKARLLDEAKRRKLQQRLLRRRAQTRIRVRKHRQLHPGGYSAKRQRILRMLADYRRTHPCVDCGEARWWVLEFDHRNPVMKLFNLSQAAGRSLVQIQAEIAKCDIRCANCHRNRHCQPLDPAPTPPLPPA